MQELPHHAGPPDGGALLVSETRLPGVRLVTLNRASRRNPLSSAMIGALRAEIGSIASAPDIAVGVLAAEGKVFSAGHDLKEIAAHRLDADGGRGFFVRLMDDCAALMQEIVACPKPIVAAVEGTATAAGCQLVATCDLAVAGDSAVFATPGVNIGLFCSTPMVALSRNVGRKAAMEMLLTGEPISATRAEAIGLVNRVVAEGQALAAAIDLAAVIAAKPRPTVRLGKATFYRQLEMGLAEAYRTAAEVMVANMLAAEAVEGIDAFLCKRPPRWQE